MELKYKDGRMMQRRLTMNASHQRYLLYDNNLRGPGINNLPQRRRAGEEQIPVVDLSDPNSDFFIKQTNTPTPRVSNKGNQTIFPETPKKMKTHAADPQLLTKRLDHIAERQESYRKLNGGPIFGSDPVLTGEPPEFSNWGPPPVNVPGLKNPTQLKFTMPIRGVDLPEVAERLKLLKEIEKKPKVVKVPTRIYKYGSKELVSLSNSKEHEFYRVIGKPRLDKSTKDQNSGENKETNYTAKLTKNAKTRILKLIEERQQDELDFQKMSDKSKYQNRNSGRIDPSINLKPPPMNLNLKSTNFKFPPNPTNFKQLSSMNRNYLTSTNLKLPSIYPNDLAYGHVTKHSIPKDLASGHVTKHSIPKDLASGHVTKHSIHPNNLTSGQVKNSSMNPNGLASADFKQRHLPINQNNLKNSSVNPNNFASANFTEIPPINFESFKLPSIRSTVIRKENQYTAPPVSTIVKLPSIYPLSKNTNLGPETIYYPKKPEVLRLPNILNQYHLDRMTEMEQFEKPRTERLTGAPTTRSHRNSPLIFNVRLNGKQATPAILDTALSFSLITKRLADELSLSKYMVPQYSAMKVIYSLSPILDPIKYPRVLGSIHSVRVRAGLAIPIVMNFQVVQEAQCDCVLGVDFVRMSRAVVNLREETIAFDQGKTRVHFLSPNHVNVMGRRLGGNVNANAGSRKKHM